MSEQLPRVSIVIPALNEEELLPKLLESVKNQTVQNYEVIVADAGSKDKTRQLAEQYGARVVEGGMPGPGRNRGAEVARGEFLFFFDADVVLPPDFIDKALSELDDRFIDLATCEFKPQSELRLDRVMFNLANLAVKINQTINPRAAGFAIFITRRLFNRVGGFDESLKLAEDHDLVERASKFRPLRFLNTVSLSVSIRRLEKEGRFALIEKYMQVELHLMTKGSIKDDVVEYEFANFDNDSRNKKLLDELEERVIQMEKQYNDFSKQVSNSALVQFGEKLNENRKALAENVKGAFEKLRENLAPKGQQQDVN